MKSYSINIVVLLVLLIIVSILLSGGYLGSSEPPSVLPDKEYKVVSVQQIRKDTIFTHHYDIQAGYIGADGKIVFEDFEMDSIIYSNDTKIVRVQRGYFGEHNELYWNGIEVK